jgi:hypothetical protein
MVVLPSREVGGKDRDVHIITVCPDENTCDLRVKG